ncbi:MAG: BatA domain-containing protein [Acidobacteriota bacterium]
MGLFSPWFLAGALAVGLPIWLHLLKRSKTDPKQFPSLMFFEHRETSSVKHRKLDYILLFILRTLMLLLLALLFAHPYFRRSTPANKGERITVIAVDRSFSMRASSGASTRLDQAKAEALSVLNSVPANTKAQVVALSGKLEAMTQQVTDVGQLRAAINAIQPSDSRASYGELARYLRTLRDSAGVPIDVHLISDLQKSGMPPGFNDLRLQPGTNLTLHPIGPKDKPQPNWAVESVNAPARIYDNKKAHISATIAGFNAPASTRTVSLVLNGKTVASKSVQVPENGRGTVEFVGLEASFGFNKCEVRIDSADGLAADDRYPFAVEHADSKKILFVDDGRRPNPQKFFRAALESSGDTEFAMDVLSPPAAAGSTLNGYSVVVLSDLGSLPGGLEANLQKFVSAGGGLFESLGVNSISMAKAPVLDEAILGSAYAQKTGDRFYSVAEMDQTHPVVKSLEHMDGVEFFQAAMVASTKANVLARLSDGTPLLLEKRVGEGYVLAFTSSLDQASNNFPYKPVYVPFVEEVVRYLGRGGAGQPANMPVDGFVELRSGTGQQGVTTEVLDPDGQRVLTLDEAATARNFALSREGFFEVKNAAGRRSIIAAVADRRESDLTPLPEESQKLWIATGASNDPGVQTAQTAATKVDGAVNQISLAPYLLVLLLLLALAESVIANRYLRSSAQPLES